MRIGTKTEETREVDSAEEARAGRSTEWGNTGMDDRPSSKGNGRK